MKTHAQYVIEVAKVNPRLEVIGEYLGSHVRIKHRHICGHEWLVSPTHVLHTGRECNKCGGSMKKTHDVYVAEISKINPSIQVLGEYVNDRTKIRHRHDCGHEWDVMPNSILRGYGCPKCADSGCHRKTHQEYVHEAYKANKSITVLGTYLDARTPILHKHECGYEWMIRPDDVKHGYGCPVCANRGFQVGKSGVLYYFMIEYNGIRAIKYGISSNFTTRMKKHKTNLNLAGAKIISEVTFIEMSGRDILDLEKLIKRNYKGKLTIPIEGFRTEVIPADKLEEFKKIVD